MDRQILFGKKIRAIRDAANLSRELTAEKAQINANYLGELERGEKWPSLEVLEALSGALDVSLDVFFSFDEQEIDPDLLLRKLRQLLTGRDVEQLQQALRVLKALFGA